MTNLVKEDLQLILEDLNLIFGQDGLDLDSNIIGHLKSYEVKKYIQDLGISKPETALREAFFAGRATLTSYLANSLSISPEASILGAGFIDYKINFGNKFVLLELKSLFEPITEKSKSGKSIKILKQKPLKWEDHQDQILKYISQGGEFIIVTNLKQWYFFNDQVSPDNCKPFYQKNLLDFVTEFSESTDLLDYLERKESQVIREDLDKKFFESLKSWVGKLSDIEFKTGDTSRLDYAIGVINQFIFAQTLDDFGVIKFRFLKDTWDIAQQRWGSKRKYLVLKEFFSLLTEWFYEFYDTEMFRVNILQHIKENVDNMDKLYESLELILGIKYWNTALGGYKGILQYNFRYIDEDIFGKAYETFLVDVRHDEGIYYTPPYVTNYIVENTVGKVMDELASRIQELISEENLDRAIELSHQFVSVKILDPACGSGSFLVKCVKGIFKRYESMKLQIANIRQTYYDAFNGTLDRPKEIEEKAVKLEEISQIMKLGNKRDMIAAILLRHIHGNDLDQRALNVTKLNLWLESVKLVPSEYRYETLPKDTNRILPALELNLTNGNSLVGLPDEVAIDKLRKYKAELAYISTLRNTYLASPSKPELVYDIQSTLSTLRIDLEIEFRKFLESEGMSEKIMSETKSFHWPLEFWYLYFSDNGEPLPAELRGVDALVGNPPYERIQVLKNKSPNYVKYLNSSVFKARYGNFDLAILFIEKGYNLLKSLGEFGYIVTNKFIQSEYGRNLRSILTSNRSIREIVDFGDQQIFDDATTYTTLLFLNKKDNSTYKYTLIKKLAGNLQQLENVRIITDLETSTEIVMTANSSTLSDAPWVFIGKDEECIFKKISGMQPLGKVVDDNIFDGLQTSAEDIYRVEDVGASKNYLEFSSKVNQKKYLVEKDIFKPVLTGEDVKKWYIDWKNTWVLFPYRIGTDVKLIDQSEMKSMYPKTWRYLLDHKSILDEREKGTWKNRNNWHAYVYPKNLNLFKESKLIVKVLSRNSSFPFDDSGRYYFVGGGNGPIYGIILENKYMLSYDYLMSLLNSSFIDYLVHKKSTRFHGGYFSYAKRFIEWLPIKIAIDKNEQQFVSRVEKLAKKILSLNENRRNFLNTWLNWSDTMHNLERTLHDILKDDLARIRTNRNGNDIWFSKVSFYHDNKPENGLRTIMISKYMAM